LRQINIIDLTKLRLVFFFDQYKIEKMLYITYNTKDCLVIIFKINFNSLASKQQYIVVKNKYKFENFNKSQ